jgi:hypothetical protein
MLLQYDLAKALNAQRIREAEAYRLAKQVRPAKRRSMLSKARDSLRSLVVSLQAHRPAQRAESSAGS